VQLFGGLVLYGVSMAMLVRSTLGLDPWDVLHDGISERSGLSFGTVVILVGVAVLALWIPLRQWPGLGTVANAVVIGVATDVSLAVLDAPEARGLQVLLLVGGVVANGLAGALYIGSQFGTGPRDGLMTGLVRRTGHSIRLCEPVWRSPSSHWAGCSVAPWDSAPRSTPSRSGRSCSCSSGGASSSCHHGRRLSGGWRVSPTSRR
jgi:uncharacterized membrane protein YczE